MENTREIHRKKKSMIYRMVGVLAVVLAAAVCYTATVFAWFSASIVNTGSSITAASHYMNVVIRQGGTTLYTENQITYVDQTVNIQLDENGKGSLVFEFFSPEESADFSYHFKASSDDATIKTGSTSNGAYTHGDSPKTQSIEVQITGEESATVSVRVSCVTSFTKNDANVVYVDQATDLSENTHPDTKNYIYFLRNNITLDKVLHFTGSGSISIILNGYELNVLGIQVDADTTRFVSISDGKLVINGETIGNGSPMNLGENVRLSLSGLREESKPSPTEPEQQPEPPVEDGEPDVTEPESAPEETTIPAGENSVPESFPAESETGLLH